MKTQAEYLAWIDTQIAIVDLVITLADANSQERSAQTKLFVKYRASLLGNRDVLVRHEGKPIGLRKIMGYTCVGCSSISDEYDFEWPCPTRTDITKRLDEVM